MIKNGGVDMKRQYKRHVAKMVLAILFLFGISQPVFAEDLGSYSSDDVQNYSADSLGVTELWLNKPNGLVNNTKKTLDVSPFLKDGRTMVPLRFIGESAGADVKWSDAEQKITITLDGNTIVLWIGKSEAKINNNTVSLDVPAMKYNNRTVVPLRFVSENLKLKVDFNGNTNKITITNNKTKGSQPSTTQKTSSTTNGSKINDIVKSNKTYTGQSTSGAYSQEFSLTFTNVNQSGEFQGKLEWIGYNVTDDIEGVISGDQILFSQIARHQNDKTTSMDVDITMKMDSNNRVSGTWKDNQSGNTGTLWFTSEPSKSVSQEPAQKKAPEVVYEGKFDAKGYPIGKTKIEFGNYFTFDGEINVEKNNAVAIGVITYPDKTKVIGRFVNGKPDGLNSIIYPNKKAYLVDFTYGEPVDVYVANTIPTYKSDELAIYKSNDIGVIQADDIDQFQADDIDYFQADDIDYFQADDIEIFQADNIEPYKAEMIELYQAEQVEKIASVADVKKYEADVAKLSPAGSKSDIPPGGFSSPDYMNPMVQMWTSHMLKLPFLMNNNMSYAP